jgi:hypothetical protein
MMESGLCHSHCIDYRDDGRGSNKWVDQLCQWMADLSPTLTNRPHVAPSPMYTNFLRPSREKDEDSVAPLWKMGTNKSYPKHIFEQNDHLCNLKHLLGKENMFLTHMA